jgi:hypothetical protein
MKKIADNKTHIIINASNSEKDIDNSFKIDYTKLKDLKKQALIIIFKKYLLLLSQYMKF